MRVVRRRSPWLQAATVLGGFFVGPYCAFLLSSVLVPDSELVQGVSVFSFFLVFVGGSMLWMGLGVATVVLGASWSLVRGRGLPRAPSGPSSSLVPPGYKAYVILGPLIGAAVGLLAGVASEMRLLAAVGLWGLLGLAYGLALWAAAHNGYLPFPEPEG
ncbi:MAG: hypothetical protein OEM23_04570 [Gemmatimonadota bacterium]|nr:hypothetical protein [Gemmatimonadota bacterium]